MIYELEKLYSSLVKEFVARMPYVGLSWIGIDHDEIELTTPILSSEMIQKILYYSVPLGVNFYFLADAENLKIRFYDI